MHSKKILYRDLKPENVLFRRNGYVLLADYGLAKQLEEDNQRAFSFCGTAEYLAPEMLTDKGHDYALDWWTLGILLYEMLTGIPPFYNKDRPVMFRNIRSAKVRFPNKNKDNFEVSPAAQDLILSLL